MRRSRDWVTNSARSWCCATSPTSPRPRSRPFSASHPERSRAERREPSPRSPRTRHSVTSSPDRRGEVMIDEREVAELLRAATDDIAVPVASARELAAAGNRRRRRRRVVASLATAAAVAAVAVAVPVVLSSDRSGATVPRGLDTIAPGASCVDPVPSRVLPGWARTRVRRSAPPDAVRGGRQRCHRRDLLRPTADAPPSPITTTRSSGSPASTTTRSLHITATLADGSATVTRVVDGGPGPSTIDLPRPGARDRAIARSRRRAGALRGRDDGAGVALSRGSSPARR